MVLYTRGSRVFIGSGCIFYLGSVLGLALRVSVGASEILFEYLDRFDKGLYLLNPCVLWIDLMLLSPVILVFIFTRTYLM